MARAAAPAGPPASFVEDIADGAAPVSLVAAAPKIEARPSRHPGAHAGPREVARVGLGIVVAGGMLVLARYAADALLDTPSDAAARQRRRIGHVGWGAVTLGGALVVGAFAVELDRRPARAAGGPAPPGSLSLGVGVGSVQVGGRF
jgi:hypothetical protein